MLSHQEEIELFQNGDRDALFNSHMGYAESLAKNYANPNVPMEDLKQEAYIGLLKAIDKFDLSKGTRLGSYAKRWIVSGVLYLIYNNLRIVNIVKHRSDKALFFCIRSVIKGTQVKLTPDQVAFIADKMKRSNSDVRAMEADITCLETKDPSTSLYNLHSDVDDAEENKRTLARLFKALTKRERTVIHSRFLAEDKVGLVSLGDQLGVSHQRIKQIQEAALGKMRASSEGISSHP